MQLKDHVKPITYVKAHAAELLEQVAVTRQPLIVTQKGEARAVLLDVETYDSWRKALAMLKIIAISEASAADKGWIPQDQVFADVERAFVEVEEHG
jgi:prevent-host-death family protein